MMIAPVAYLDVEFAPAESTQLASAKPPPNPDPDPEEPPPPPDFPSKILNLAPAGIRTTFGTETLLDIGSDATIEAGSTPLKLLRIHLPNITLNPFESIGLRENDHVAASNGTLPGSTITVDGVEIGAVSMSSDQWAIIVNFNENATPSRVQEFVRTLTYTNTDLNRHIHSGDIEFALQDISGESWSEYANVIVAPEGEMVLTPGVDSFSGRESDDVFYALTQSFTSGDVITAGDGFDTLSLVGGGMFFLNSATALLGIEKIEGSKEEDSIIIGAGQLAAVQVLDGGASRDGERNFLQLKGDYFDLTGKEILNFAEINVEDGGTIVVADVNMAKLVWGRTKLGDTLILSQGTLTEAERLQIHRQGIDTIVTLADGATTTHKPAEITDLGGDHVTLNAAKVFIDAGRNVTIESDNGLMGYLDITVNNAIERDDTLGIETSERIALSDGLRANSRVLVGGTDIGAVIAAYDPAFPDYLGFNFNSNATPDLVEELVQAITYSNAKGRILENREILLKFGDIGLRPSRDQIVTIEPEANVAPTAIRLSTATVAELSRNGSVIGTLTAQDANIGETFTYTLTNDAGGRFAIVDDKLVVKEGVRIDYDQARSYAVMVQVKDARGLTFEKKFTINVTDINPERTAGTAAHDTIVGGVGKDTLSGGGGNDRLVGGRGADALSGGQGDDMLTGGIGADTLSGGTGKDTFIFGPGDTGLGGARDTVLDFRHGADRIDLSRIDANTATRADNRFTELLSAGKTFTKAGQLRYDVGTGILSGNTDGDAQAEFQIVLKNKPALLHLADFIL